MTEPLATMEDDVPFPLSYPLCVALANDAVKLAVVKATSMLRTAKGAQGFYPIATGDGEFGIGIHPWAYYMKYQNDGFPPFTMWALQGKTVPIRLPDGRVLFRVASNVGAPGKINKRDEKGRIAKGNTGVKWRHPGLKPKNFLDDAIDEALAVHSAEIVYELAVNAVRGELT
jgi:hypothetical protein